VTTTRRQPATGTREPARPRRIAYGLGDLVVMAAATALWIVALHRTHIRDVGAYGLLATISPLYFVALVLIVAGFLAEIARGARRGWVPVAYTVLLILLLHATTPALLAEPEYPWTYKHIGVIELFLQHGRVLDSGDLYQEWPAFFVTGAWLSKLSGVAPLDYATWAPVVFNLTGSLILLAIARTLTTDRRVAYLTVFLFQCINWIEEDYLSPQGFAFVLTLGVILVVLRWLRPALAPAAGRSRISRARAWLVRGVPPAPSMSRPARAGALLLFAALVAVVTASHQLSPYMIVFDLLVLVLVGLVTPWWTVLVALVIPIGYLVPRWHLVSADFKVFESIDILHNASGNAAGWGSDGQAFSALVVRTLAIVAWLLVLVRLLLAARRNRFGTVIRPALLTFAPFALLFAQSYGGEAIYRVFLFSAPWCGYLLADLVVRAGQRLEARPRTRTGGGRLALFTVAVLVTTLAALASVQGRHGQLEVDQQSTASVRAAEYLYAHGQPGATIVLAAQDFPSRLAADYPEFNRTVPVGDPDLVTGAGLQHVRLTSAYLPRIENFARSFDGTTVYLVVSNEMRDYARYFGYLPDGSLDDLQRTLDTAPGWSVFYRNSDATIYQYSP
jgi:hypothetical protein